MKILDAAHQAIFGTGLRATHVVHGGDLVPAGTVLVTHALSGHRRA